MTKRRAKAKSTHHVFHFTAFMSALVALTAWAHQQGLITWQLPPGLANAVTQISNGTLPSISAMAANDGGGLGATAGASSDNCAAQFLGGQAPSLTNEKLAAKTHQLCYTGFAVLDSGLTRTPLWAAEHLTRERIAEAKQLKREGAFHADVNLPADERAELDDYKGYDFDRGHMAPNGDMPNKQAQAECFTLANIVPQNADNNRGVWKEIEGKVRDLAAEDSDVYVVSGPIFGGDNVETLHDRVMVPTQFFKAVYDVKRHQGAAYLVQNAAGKAYETISLSKLQSLTGINPFPGASDSATTGELALPAPTANQHG